MRVYKLINLDSTGYLLSKDKVPKILRENESQKSIDAKWYDHGSDYESDIVRLNGGWPNMAFSTRVKEQLEGTRYATGLWTKVHVNSNLFWLFHSTLVIDALDQSHSDVKRLKSGRVLEIRAYAFDPDLVPTDRIFMVKTRPYDLLCTDQFIDTVAEFSWKGFRYRPVWDSNYDPFPVRPYKRELVARPEIYGPDGIVNGYESSWPDEWKTQT